MKKQRVIAYIDGFNLYFGLKDSGFQRYYWLNLHQMVQNLLKPYQQLIGVKYFTARISLSPEKVKRQATYLEALSTIPDLGIHYGHYLKKHIECRKCGLGWDTFEEKMTDVNIATEMIFDATNDDRFDTAFLISADSDLVPPVKRIKEQNPEKKIIAFFPPKRNSNHLLKTAHNRKPFIIDRKILAKSQFADEIVKPDGFILKRPLKWR